jgi:hypothetical protein
VISGGLASTTALAGSTEAEQFIEKSVKHPERSTRGLVQPALGKVPQMPINIDPGPEEMLLPSGD